MVGVTEGAEGASPIFRIHQVLSGGSGGQGLGRTTACALCGGHVNDREEGKAEVAAEGGGHDDDDDDGDDGEEEEEEMVVPTYLVASTQDRCLQSWVCRGATFAHHRYLSKRPAEVKAIVGDGEGRVVMGDAKGNVFVWRVGARGAKPVKVVSGLSGVASMDVVEWGVVVVGCGDGRVVVVGYSDGSGEVLGVVREGGGSLREEVQGVACVSVGGSGGDGERGGLYWVDSGL